MYIPSGYDIPQRKDYSQATKYLLDLLELRHDITENSTIQVAEVLKELGYIYNETGFFNDAMLLLVEASGIYKEKGRYSDFVCYLSQIDSLYLKAD